MRDDRCVVCVVHMTIYQSDTKEGIKQHYSTLLKTILEGLPQDLPGTNHFKLPVRCFFFVSVFVFVFSSLKNIRQLQKEND